MEMLYLLVCCTTKERKLYCTLHNALHTLNLSSMCTAHDDVSHAHDLTISLLVLPRNEKKSKEKKRKKNHINSVNLNKCAEACS